MCGSRWAEWFDAIARERAERIGEVEIVVELVQGFLVLRAVLEIERANPRFDFVRLVSDGGISAAMALALKNISNVSACCFHGA